MDYAIRIPANKSLELEIEDILFRPPGRPSAKPLVRYKSFRCREGRGDSSETPAVAGRRRAASEKCGWQHACGVPTGRSTARRTPIGDQAGVECETTTTIIHRNRRFGYPSAARTTKMEILV